jgi:hypothetical protein
MFLYNVAEGGILKPCFLSVRRNRLIHELQKRRQKIGSTYFSSLRRFQRKGGPYVPEVVHAVLFPDGRDWDAMNGFRCGVWNGGWYRIMRRSNQQLFRAILLLDRRQRLGITTKA